MNRRQYNPFVKIRESIMRTFHFFFYKAYSYVKISLDYKLVKCWLLFIWTFLQVIREPYTDPTPVYKPRYDDIGNIIV